MHACDAFNNYAGDHGMCDGEVGMCDVNGSIENVCPIIKSRQTDYNM